MAWYQSFFKIFQKNPNHYYRIFTFINPTFTFHFTGNGEYQRSSDEICLKEKLAFYTIMVETMNIL
ncbi:hypothetical protein JOC33_000954 [Thalassobacillus pellis]|nr:hypothetical protein [Thalassobacillus pellis]